MGIASTQENPFKPECVHAIFAVSLVLEVSERAQFLFSSAETSRGQVYKVDLPDPWAILLELLQNSKLNLQATR